MTLALSLFAVTAAIELLIYVFPVWHMRRVLAAGTLVAIGCTSGLLFADKVCLATGFLGVISLYRIFNLSRLVEGRMHEQYLRRVTLRSSLLLITAQVFAVVIWELVDRLKLTSQLGWWLLALGQLLAAIIICKSTFKHVRTSHQLTPEKSLSDHDLPSISICIPARNETDALQACLASLTSNKYPKLEIMVLDDCSQDKTSDIIKSFAHEGVRFIKGNEPPSRWLAKNWAYARLAEEASGEILVFCGVDIKFSEQSLRSLISSMLAERTRMACLIPRNEMVIWGRTGRSTLLQPVRYAWELCLPRELLHRQPVLSSCWAIEKKLLVQSGGFEAVLAAITPEAYFAERAAETGGYRFIAADDELAVSSSKNFHEQWDTAVRTRYPQLHRRPENVLVLSLLELLCLIGPLGVAIGALLLHSWLLASVSAFAYCLQAISYSLVVRLTYRRFLFRAWFSLPVAALLDIFIRHYSMWAYEFSEVLWKGRNVCLPVMHIEPHLPDAP